MYINVGLIEIVTKVLHAQFVSRFCAYLRAHFHRRQLRAIHQDMDLDDQITVIFSHRERGKSLYMAVEVAMLCAVLINPLRVVDDVYCCAVCNL